MELNASFYPPCRHQGGKVPWAAISLPIRYATRVCSSLYGFFTASLLSRRIDDDARRLRFVDLLSFFRFRSLFMAELSPICRKIRRRDRVQRVHGRYLVLRGRGRFAPLEIIPSSDSRTTRLNSKRSSRTLRAWSSRLFRAKSCRGLTFSSILATSSRDILSRTIGLKAIFSLLEASSSNTLSRTVRFEAISPLRRPRGTSFRGRRYFQRQSRGISYQFGALLSAPQSILEQQAVLVPFVSQRQPLSIIAQRPRGTSLRGRLDSRHFPEKSCRFRAILFAATSIILGISSCLVVEDPRSGHSLRHFPPAQARTYSII